MHRPASADADIKAGATRCDEEDDPAGVVYDRAAYDAARAKGKSDADARRDAAVAGVTVVLQQRARHWAATPRDVGTQVTGATGAFQWFVSPGSYRVKVSKAGYETAVSRTVQVPPAVTDLHVALTRRSPSDGPDAGAALVLPLGLLFGVGIVLRRRSREGLS